MRSTVKSEEIRRKLELLLLFIHFIPLLKASVVNKQEKEREKAEWKTLLSGKSREVEKERRRRNTTEKKEWRRS